MHRPTSARTLRFGVLLLLVLAFLPLKAGAHKGTVEATLEVAPYHYYFPIVFSYTHPDLPAPDLVVEAITVNSDSAVVVIKNQGGAPAEHVELFWIDLYIDPDPMPTAPNQVWDRLCDQGLVWAIPSQALPLDPGETLTLTYCPEQEEPGPYYSDELSKFEIALDPGTPIAVQVDSANIESTYGGVLEDHEVLGWTYNNISTTVSIAGAGCEAARPAPSIGPLPFTPSYGLPPRPGHAE